MTTECSSGYCGFDPAAGMPHTCPPHERADDFVTALARVLHEHDVPDVDTLVRTCVESAQDAGLLPEGYSPEQALAAAKQPRVITEATLISVGPVLHGGEPILSVDGEPYARPQADADPDTAPMAGD